MPTRLDHVVFGCLDLAAGEAALTETFGAPAPGHGEHVMMSTHNALWNMGDAYIELVAINPKAPDPGRPRWFGLDEAATKARLADGPRLLTWIVATDDAAAIANAAPEPFDAPEAFARDDLQWRMAVPKSGAPALDGVFPGPIEWISGLHPAKRLGDQGIRYEALILSHPQIGDVASAMTLSDPFISFGAGSSQIELTLSTPNGAQSFTAFD